MPKPAGPPTAIPLGNGIFLAKVNLNFIFDINTIMKVTVT